MLSLLLLFFRRLKYIGQIPLCNGIAKRAPHLFGYCFILCWRCTAIYTTALFTFVYWHQKKVIFTSRQVIYALLLWIPMMIDGGLQTLGILESTNMRRIMTGGLFGIGFMIVVLYIYQYLEKKIYRGGREDVLYKMR